MAELRIILFFQVLIPNLFVVIVYYVSKLLIICTFTLLHVHSMKLTTCLEIICMPFCNNLYKIRVFTSKTNEVYPVSFLPPAESQNNINELCMYQENT